MTHLENNFYISAIEGYPFEEASFKGFQPFGGPASRVARDKCRDGRNVIPYMCMRCIGVCVMRWDVVVGVVGVHECDCLVA